MTTTERTDAKEPGASAVIETTQSVEITRRGRIVGRANFTRFAAYGDDTPRYSISLDHEAGEYYGVPEGELLGWVARRKGRWEPMGCHDLEAALSLENLEMATFLPTASSRSEAVWMLAKLRWAERHPDAPREKLRAARWAGVRIPQRWIDNA